jgi:transposase
MLDGKQQQQVEQIREGHADLEAAYQLRQAFITTLAERRDKDLDTWLSQAQQSGFPEFQRLAHGMRRDYTAVRAAFSSPISNDHVA